MTRRERFLGNVLQRGPGSTGRPVALVLSGGGLSGGMFEVGCLAALDEFLAPEHRINDLGLFVGVSAGALVAALVANGVRPLDARDAIRRDLPSPLNIKLGNVAGTPWRAAWGAALGTVRKAVGQLAPLARARGNGWAAMVPQLLAESLPAGLFSMDRLEGHLGRLLSTPPRSNDFRNLRSRLYIPAIALDTGERWVFGEPPLADVPISRAVAASAAIPGFFEPVPINGMDFIDGGVDRVEHLDIATAHGARAIVLINPLVPFVNRGDACLPRLTGGCARLREKGGPLIKEQAARLNRQRKLLLSLERHRHEYPDVPVFLIEPDSATASLFLEDMMSDAARLDALEEGYRVTGRWLALNGTRLRGALGSQSGRTAGRPGARILLAARRRLAALFGRRAGPREPPEVREGTRETGPDAGMNRPRHGFGS